MSEIEYEADGKTPKAKKNKRYTIVYDRENCIGAGVCVAISPDNWYFDDDGLASVVKVDIDEAEFQENYEAAEGCPVNVIKIYDNETGKQVI
jgi:ferredoxin